MNIFKNFKSNFTKGLKKLNLRGRSSRKEILQITVFTPLTIFLGLIVTAFIGSITNIEFIFYTGFFIAMICLLFNAFASIFAIGRRLQDLNVHGFLALPLIFLAPVLYFIIGLFLLMLPSGKHNKYGPNLENLDINSESVENYIYYKYFAANPYHQGMTAEASTSYNKKQAEMYLKLIPAAEKLEFDNLSNAHMDKEIDFSQNLPVLNGASIHSELLKKHKLNDINYNLLFSELQSYANETHNKEFNG